MKTALSALLSLFLLGCGGSESGNGSGGSAVAGPATVLYTPSEPIYESPLSIASDASVVRVDSDTLYMYYSAENFTIGLVVSGDNGRTWQHPEGATEQDFSVFSGAANGWDQVIETVDVSFVDDVIYMYYTGYREGESDNGFVSNYQVGLAISTDGGLSFERHPESVQGPVMAISSDDLAMDRHAITSPNVIVSNGVFYMSYTGWNVADDFAAEEAGFYMLGAISSDGVHWQKLSQPLFQNQSISWLGDQSTVTETDLVLTDGGDWIIFFTAEEGLGFGVANAFDGDYRFGLSPVVEKQFPWHATELVAPEVIVEPGIETTDTVFRIWYTGAANEGFFPAVVGYTERLFLLP